MSGAELAAMESEIAAMKLAIARMDADIVAATAPVEAWNRMMPFVAGFLVIHAAVAVYLIVKYVMMCARDRQIAAAFRELEARHAGAEPVAMK